MPVDLHAMEEVARQIGRVISKASTDAFGRQKVGFCFLMFDFGEGGNLTYISNANREDMIKAFNEFIGKL